MARLFVFGGGGHARVVIATAVAAGFDVEGIFDDNADLAGTAIDGVSVIGPFDGNLADDAICVIAIGDNRIRYRVARQLDDRPFATIVHPRAIVHESVGLGEGTVVFAGAIIQPGTTVGRHGIINTGATVDHDCMLGDFVHVAPGTHLAGNVTLGDHVFMGIASAAIPGVRIGARSVVGAGGVVVKDVADDTRVVGVPAREIGDLRQSGRGRQH